VTTQILITFASSLLSFTDKNTSYQATKAVIIGTHTDRVDIANVSYK